MKLLEIIQFGKSVAAGTPITSFEEAVKRYLAADYLDRRFPVDGDEPDYSDSGTVQNELIALSREKLLGIQLPELREKAGEQLIDFLQAQKFDLDFALEIHNALYFAPDLEQKYHGWIEDCETRQKVYIQACWIQYENKPRETIGSDEYESFVKENWG